MQNTKYKLVENVTYCFYSYIFVENDIYISQKYESIVIMQAIHRLSACLAEVEKIEEQEQKEPGKEILLSSNDDIIQQIVKGPCPVKKIGICFMLEVFTNFCCNVKRLESISQLFYYLWLILKISCKILINFQWFQNDFSLRLE